MVESGNAEFDKAVAENRRIVALFATGSPTSAEAKARLDELAPAYSGVVDVFHFSHAEDATKAFMKESGIIAAPTLRFMVGEKVIDTYRGANADAIKTRIASLAEAGGAAPAPAPAAQPSTAAAADAPTPGAQPSAAPTAASPETTPAAQPTPESSPAAPASAAPAES
ncbi:thioredoxin family protein [Nocardia jejuensis]|uniref:thioredoxin family protein n=1 Tax=Nocardia jejuensis TaxID=328049 RepID=UPI00082EFDEF|nr:thioredoxin family protein [Nocardia jejuensis]